jgi:WD40 repeat protein
LITSLAFDGTGTLWAGGFDGILRGYDYEEQGADGRPLMVRQKHPLHEMNCGSGIVSVSVNDDIGCGVASTVEDGIILFSLEDGEILGRWNPYVKKIRDEFVRSAIIVQNDKASSSFGMDDAWSVLCGGSRGSMFQRRLNVDRTGDVSESHPFMDQTKQGSGLHPIKMRPSHVGTVMNLASPAPGLVVSGAQDGSMRVWDCSTSESSEEEEDDDDDEEEEAQYDDIQPSDSRPQCLYALSGYKVWLGSIFANGKKLVSDGADNTIIVHSFDGDEGDVLFREDDEDDIEGLSLE